MAQNLRDNMIDLERRKALLKTFPCFYSLSVIQSEELAKRFHEVTYHPQEKIVVENDLVDSIFIIVSGDAEATRTVVGRNKSNQLPIAVLHAGEGIGLYDMGFYSESGKRKATVTAMNDMLLLKLDMNDLYEFLKKNNLEVSMQTASLQMLRMRFIKQSLPFSKISHERLQWLANCVEDIFVPAGTVIFNQGDDGNQCYLIRSGNIEIFSRNENGKDKQLAILTTSVLFGEATLITRSQRNASARALEDSELLVLKYDHLSELIESENNVAKMVMTLMVDRSRPFQNPHVSLHQRTTADGQTMTILKNPDNAGYFRLSEEGIFIWNRLDGKHTLQDITMELSDQCNVFAPDVVAALISKLNMSGYIKNLEANNEILKTTQSFWASVIASLKRVFEARFAFGDSDKRITTIYQNYIRYLFTKPVQMIFAIVAIWGFFSFVSETSDIIQFFTVKHAGVLLLLGLIPFSLIAVILHELGHAFAVKAFGREVHYIGIGWFWFGPIAFTDTSDIWLASRKERMIVNFAGIYVDILLAGITSLCIVIVTNAYIQAALWLCALYTYIGAFRKVSPLQDSDGYYILMDWLEKTKLRFISVIWLAKKFPESIRNPSLFKENKAEVIYWITCITYLILTTLLTLVIQDFVLSAAGIHLANRYFALILPFIVLIISCLTIIADVRIQSE